MSSAVMRYNYKRNAKQRIHIKDILVSEGIVDKPRLKNDEAYNYVRFFDFYEGNTFEFGRGWDWTG